MIELEDRLRTALTDLADEVPPSRDALAEQRRRLATAPRPSRRRRSMLAAAAAAAVIAASVPASIMSRSGPAAPAGPSESFGYDPSPDGPYLTITDGPLPLGEFTEDGRRWAAWAFLERHPEGTGWANRLCVVGVPAGDPVNGPVKHPNSAGGCLPVHPWPVPVPHTSYASYVDMRVVLGGPTLDSGPLPGLVLFVTAPQVSTLEAIAADGGAVPVKQLGRTDELALFLVDFGASAQGTGFRARDAAGNVIDSAVS